MKKMNFQFSEKTDMKKGYLSGNAQTPLRYRSDGQKKRPHRTPCKPPDLKKTVWGMSEKNRSS